MNAKDFDVFPEVQTERRRYETAGLDFPPILDAAIGKATEGIKNPTARGVASTVAWVLYNAFDEHLAQHQATTRAGRWIRFLWSIGKLFNLRRNADK